VTGVTSYGDPAFNDGYLYDDSVDVFVTTALDFDPTDTPSVWSLNTDELCVEQSARGSRRMFQRLDTAALITKRGKS
jgi:hypothetical protein